MHKKRTRLLSLLLVGALLLGLYPLPGLAEASPSPQATQTDITESPPENEAAPSMEPDTGPLQPPADSETEEPTRQPTEEAPPTPAEEPAQEFKRFGGVAAKCLRSILHLVCYGIAQHLFEGVEYLFADLCRVSRAPGHLFDEFLFVHLVSDAFQALIIIGMSSMSVVLGCLSS